MVWMSDGRTGEWAVYDGRLMGSASHGFVLRKGEGGFGIFLWLSMPCSCVWEMCLIPPLGPNHRGFQDQFLLKKTSEFSSSCASNLGGG